MKIMMVMLILLLSSCGKSYHFDGFDPTTATVKWIIKNEKNN